MPTLVGTGDGVGESTARPLKGRGVRADAATMRPRRDRLPRTVPGAARLGSLLLLVLVLVAAVLAGPGAPAPAHAVTSSAPSSASLLAPATVASTAGTTSRVPGRSRIGKVLRATPRAGSPAFAWHVPASTSQVVRTVRTDRWCRDRWCTVTQAWSRDSQGRWSLVRSFRSQIGPNGFIDADDRVAGDGTTPAGAYRVATTFSTDSTNPGTAMPWKPRLPTSTVSGTRRWYNTWIEEAGRTDGTRAAMRWGLWLDYNHARVVPDQGPAPVWGKGSGIFLHTMGPAARYSPSAGCIAIGEPSQVRWIVLWLRPDAHPRIVNDV